jgi:hypothetical protein
MFSDNWGKINLFIVDLIYLLCSKWGGARTTLEFIRSLLTVIAVKMLIGAQQKLPSTY